MAQSVLLLVRCFGLQVDSSVVFPGMGSIGVMSNLFRKAISISTGADVASKHEKRYIQISKSEGFKPGGRPTTFEYEIIYQSEVMENNIDIFPSLVCTIKYSEELDYNIRVNVYYSSNKTNGKDVVLCGSLFNLKSILQSSSDVITDIMTSEYCYGSHIYIQKRYLLPLVLYSNASSPFLCGAESKAHNPLQQSYSFYNPEDYTYPMIDVDELTIEPRLFAKISMSLLKNFIPILSKSVHAWRRRRVLERLRQSKFLDNKEAFSYGWKELKICIKSVSIDDKVENERMSIGQLYGSDNVTVGINPRTQNNPTNKNISLAAANKDSNSKEKEKAPSTYVEVVLHEADKSLDTFIGRTNTEYHTYEPSYGSNKNSILSLKSSTNYSVNPTNNIRLVKLNCSTTVSGIEKNYFCKYIPSIEGTVIRLNLYLEEVALLGSTSYLKGTCTIPLSDANGSIILTNINRDVVVPMECIDTGVDSVTGVGNVANDSIVNRHIDIQVCVHIVIEEETMQIIQNDFMQSNPLKKSSGSAKVVSNTGHAAHTMGRTAVFEHNDDGSYTNPKRCSVTNSAELDQLLGTLSYEEVIAKSYEWLWHVGLTGVDPLASFAPIDVHGTNAYNHILVDNASAASGGGDSSNSATRSHRAGTAGTTIFDNFTDINSKSLYQEGEAIVPRLDYPYPLDWIDYHISALDNLISDVNTCISELENKFIAQSITIRQSALKKQKPVQALPVNLQYQISVVRSYDQDNHNKPIVVLDSVTSGCYASHGLGYKKGGLYQMENDLLNMKLLLHKQIDDFNKVVRDNEARKEEIGLQPNSNAHKLLEDIGSKVLQYETLLLNIGHRRLFSVAQVVNTAINCFLMKLSLVAEGYILPGIAQRWLEYGFLIVFEGLLSVIGNERAMLEDTISAIETLRLYRIVITEVKQESHETSVIRLSNVEINGREINLQLSKAALAALPPCYTPSGESNKVVIKIKPILFTQGIDLVQSTASTFSADAIYIQHTTNIRGLKYLNNYCHKSQPINCVSGDSGDNGKSAQGGSRQSHTHPLIQDLSELIRNSNFGTKNVEMLMEIERICLMLNGCRVTFCKSGKDRTGMAVTLEQSRQLGERFGIGIGFDRVLKDANIMRQYGTRIKVCEKNIGKPVYSINKFQASFLPHLYRPPEAVLEDMIKTGKDTS